MTLDGTGTASNVHAIYFTGNDKLNVQNGSSLTIQNYKQDALSGTAVTAATMSTSPMAPATLPTTTGLRLYRHLCCHSG